MIKYSKGGFMLIEKIGLKSTRNSNIFELLIDGEKYTLHSDIIVKYGLSTGGEIAKDKLNTIVEESDIVIASNLAMKYVSTKLVTSKQLKDYLRGKGYNVTVVKRVADKCNEYGIVNDQNFASSYINIKQNNLSKRALENKLMQKGISKEISLEYLQDFDDLNVAIMTANKFMKNKEFTEENITKLLRHLSYKGFDYETINKVINNIKNNIKN